MAIAYRLTSAAENDFIEILDYTTREWGISQAEKYAAEIEGCLQAIVASPGRAKPIFVEAIRILIWRCKCHYIFYLERGEFVDVLAILHTSKDLVMHLNDRFGDC